MKEIPTLRLQSLAEIRRENRLKMWKTFFEAVAFLLAMVTVWAVIEGGCLVFSKNVTACNTTILGDDDE